MGRGPALAAGVPDGSSGPPVCTKAHRTLRGRRMHLCSQYPSDLAVGMPKPLEVMGIAGMTPVSVLRSGSTIACTLRVRQKGQVASRIMLGVGRVFALHSTDGPRTSPNPFLHESAIG